MNLEFDFMTHTYWLDGRIVPSVTQVIKSVGMSDYSKIPADILQAKAELGQIVHEATEYDDADDLDEESLCLDAIRYIEAWRKFKQDFKPVLKLAEQRLGSVKHGFAGTIDRLLAIHGLDYLLDLKASMAEPWHKVQLAGYLLLLKENGIRPAKCLNVYLQPDGNYKTAEKKPTNLKVDEAAFLHALNVHKWKLNNQRGK